MQWQTTYPTLETVMLAGYETIITWCENLLPPQNDVELTIRRRLEKRQHELMTKELRANHPEWVEQFNHVVDALRARGIDLGVERW